jgi:hypothetical protein
MSTWDKFRSEPPGGSDVVNARDLETRKKKKEQRFAMVPLKWGVAAARAGSCPRAILILWLAHLAWKANGKPFTVSNRELERMGVDRYLKYKTLRDLEKEGLIEVVRRDNNSPVVRLIGCWENPWRKGSNL